MGERSIKDDERLIGEYERLTMEYNLLRNVLTTQEGALLVILTHEGIPDGVITRENITR